jgi:hypothetical protein
VTAERFEIVVRGQLSPTLVVALDGLEVTGYDAGQSHLVGWVPDQARLHSLLERLRDLNIELTSVNRLPGADAGPDPSTRTPPPYDE